jgi:hypothetical protein
MEKYSRAEMSKAETGTHGIEGLKSSFLSRFWSENRYTVITDVDLVRLDSVRKKFDSWKIRCAYCGNQPTCISNFIVSARCPKFFRNTKSKSSDFCLFERCIFEWCSNFVPFSKFGIFVKMSLKSMNIEQFWRFDAIFKHSIKYSFSQNSLNYFCTSVK